MTTMIDLEYGASHAADYLAEKIADGRDYSRKLADMRRGKGAYDLPFHRDGRGRAFYYKSHLDDFVAAEVARVKPKKSIKKVERHDGHLGAILPPSKVIGIIA
jgi:hypothetical protein